MKMYISRLVIVGGNRTDVGSWYLYSQGDLLAWLYKENHHLQLVCWVPGLVVINKSSLLSPMLHSNNTLWLVKNSIVTWIIQRECIISLLCTVWPDWVIFESCWQQNFYQKKPKWLATFWPFWKTSLSVKNCFGYFLPQHLVTLQTVDEFLIEKKSFEIIRFI